MKNKYLFVVIMLVSILVVSLGLTTIYIGASQETEEQEGDFSVVTSFYPMYIAAKNVIGDADGVALSNLSEPQTGCLHDYQLTPADMRLLSTADVFIINGGGIESFLSDVAEAYPKLVIFEASEDVELLAETMGHSDHEAESVYHSEHAHDAEVDDTESKVHGDHDHEADTNAHAWMSVASYRVQVATIAEHLAQLDPTNAQIYRTNAAAYDGKLAELQEEQEALREQIAGQPVILFHEAYAYVAQDYGLDAVYCMDLDEERQVSAGEVADILSAIQEDGVEYIFAEESYGKDMGDTVQRESDVRVLYLDTLNRGDGSTDSYLNGMQANIQTIREAFLP
jgi:zinc transport system substrate-binding protein